MRRLNAPNGLPDDPEPFDLGQTPADVVFITANDADLAALSEARAGLDDAPSLRLADLSYLQHPLSVDRHLDGCATKSRLVIVRLLGGTGYWSFGLEQYAERLKQAGVPFAVLPGNDQPDEVLWKLSTVPRDDWLALSAYLVEGGPENATNFLRYAKAMITPCARPPAARPLLRAGVYWPGVGQTDLETVRASWLEGAPTVPLIFQRELVHGSGLNPINRLVKSLLRAGLNPLPVFVASLRDPISAATLDQLFERTAPAVILNCTPYAASVPQAALPQETNPLAASSANAAPILQVVLSSGTEEAWVKGRTGLEPRDIAAHVTLPELDGRILSRVVAFKEQAFYDEATQCPITTFRAQGDRIDFVTQLAKNWAALRATAPEDRKIALVLASYPNRNGRFANCGGLDTPQTTIDLLHLLGEEGYRVVGAPDSSADLIAQVMAGQTNWLTDGAMRSGGVEISMAEYQIFYGQLPWDLRLQIEDRWGPPEADPFYTPGEVDCGRFNLSIMGFGNVVVGIQPACGDTIEPKDTCHDPDLVPPHHYLAFYAYLRNVHRAHAIVHIGNYGHLEWLPGKALALSESCWPEAVLGPTPHVYPFIVNDPAGGMQAKRRTQAVLVGHLPPPTTRAETYGPLLDLEGLVDEYYEAASVDPRRLPHLRREILSLTAATSIDVDAGMDGENEARDLARLDTFLCELKEAQICDGLHVFGRSPEGDRARDMTIALTRVPRGDGTGGDASLIRALAEDCGVNFDPLDCDMTATYDGPRHKFLKSCGTDPWRSNGDTVERLERLAQLAVQWSETPEHFSATAAVLETIHASVIPAVRDCGPAERAGLLSALSGRFVAPAPSGAPSRGRLDVLPTGRNFFSVDSRTMPTKTAWALGWKSANLLIERHLQDHGDWPRAMLLTAWGTANMRTGGDDIALALGLMGVKPQWNCANQRVTGFEILPLSALARPRVDVTLRVSGFFRDAFPQQIALIDRAARAIMDLDEPHDQNPAAARAAAGADKARIFGSKPGAYSSGLQAMIDKGRWADKADLGTAYTASTDYARSAKADGDVAHDALRARLAEVDAIVQNQDNREHDLLESDGYYPFEGGAAAAVATLQGTERPVYHNDHSRSDRPKIRTLDEEISRVVRTRIVNPKWIDGMKRHGYNGASEIAATVDYLFAFAATTGAVKTHHFDLVHAAFIEDKATRDFIKEANAPALAEIAARLSEAIDRGLWLPKSNTAQAFLAKISSG